MKLFIICMFSVFLFACSSSSLPKAQDVSAVKSTDGTEQFIFEAVEMDDGLAHYYHLEAGGKDIRFFLVKAQDGVIRAAFDACDVCYREKKGYIQNGNNMICVNCGLAFPLDKINVISGGCNPSPLLRATNGGQIVINKNDVEEGGFYF